MGDFRTLLAWQRAIELADAIYIAVRSYPTSELYGLSQQMRRASVSIPGNIAEGRGRYTAGEQRSFYRAARGSNYELQTQIEISVRQHFIDEQRAKELTKKAAEVGRLINGLLNSLPKT